MSEKQQLPQWATGLNHNKTHFYIPPRYGRGNRNDDWTPICGYGPHIMPWGNIEEGEKDRCEKCAEIMAMMPENRDG